MSTNKQEIDLFKKQLEDFQNEMEGIRILAEEVSDKFNKLANNIENISKGLRFLGGGKTADKLAMGALLIEGAGYLLSYDKRKKAESQIKTKRAELAQLKMNTIAHMYKECEKKSERLWDLLVIEADKDLQNDINTEINNIYKIDCKNSFECYVNCCHLMNYSRFFIQEFNAWIEGKDSSDALMPDKVYIKDYILRNLILQNGIIGSLNKSGFLLLSENKSLQASYLFKSEYDLVLDETPIEQSKTKKSSYNEFKKNIEELNSLEKINSDKFSWLSNNDLYKKAKKIIRIREMLQAVATVYFIYVLIFAVFHYFSSEDTASIYFNNIKENFAPLIFGLFLFYLLVILPTFAIVNWLEKEKNNSSIFKLIYYPFYLYTSVQFLGLIPISNKLYESSRIEEYEKYLKLLYVEIND